jgi:hypothetical protein
LRSKERKKRNVSTCLQTGLPDGIFSNQKSKFGKIWECLEMKDVGKFYVLLGYVFTAIWYSLWPFGIFYCHFGIFFQYLYVVPNTSGNTAWVARWFIFKPKIPIWVHFRWPYIDLNMLTYFMAIGIILRTFWIFRPFGTFSVHLVHFGIM